MAVDINSWTDALTVIAQLKNPKAKEMYSTIIIDTLDDLVFYAEQYVMQVNGVSQMSDVPWGGAYSQLEQMLRKFFKGIVRDYGLIVVAHADLKLDENDPDKKLKYATLAVSKKAKKIVMGLLDMLIFVEGDRSQPGVTTMHFKSSENWEAKSRFQNIVDTGTLSYNNILKAINDAIGDIATAEHHKDYYADEKLYTQEEFEEIQAKTDALGVELVAIHGMGKVLEVVTSVLGKKISETDVGDTAALHALYGELQSM